MATFVQGKTSTAADPAQVVMDSGPTEDNLLVALVSERSGGDASNHSVPGFTLRVSRTIEQGAGTYRKTISLHTKEAGAAEASTFTADDGTANNKVMTVTEYAWEGSEDQWTFLEAASNDDGQVDDSTVLNTGTTVSVSSSNMFVLGACIMKIRSIYTGATDAWDNNLVGRFDDSDGGDQFAHYIGTDEVDTVTGTKDSTVTLTGDTSNRGLGTAIMVFDTLSGAVTTLASLMMGANLGQDLFNGTLIQ